MNTGCRLITVLVMAAGLAACISRTAGEIRFDSKQAALPAMEHIALNASRCWFKSGDTAFKPYRLAPELQSFSDRPRLLIVPYHNPADKPLLVVEARGTPARISAYGPLLHSKTARRIAKDIRQWAQGQKKC